MTDLHALDLLINLAGLNASAMDAALAAARGNGVTDPDVAKAHDLVGRMGVVLSKMQQWVDAAMVPPTAPTGHLVIKAPDLAPLSGDALQAMRVVQGHGLTPASTSAYTAMVSALNQAGITDENTIREYITAYGPGGALNGSL